MNKLTDFRTARPRRNGLLTWLTRTLAFFTKELAEVRRQPRLIASLVGGPFLVLVIFGAGYQRSTPDLRTALVLPPGGVAGLDTAQMTKLIGTNFNLVNANIDRPSAEAQLRSGALDVVQVFPPDALAAVQRGETPKVEFLTGTINPVTEGWIQYLAYAEVNEINRSLLTMATTNAQQQTGGLSAQLADARKNVAAATDSAQPAQIAATTASLHRLRDSINTVLTELPPDADASGQVAQSRASLQQLRDQTDETLTLLESGQVEAGLAKLRELRVTMDRMDSQLTTFRSVSADRIVSPVARSFANIRGTAYSPVVFYAPGVLALLIQHTAITLGALALVRERMMGALEIFRVSPVQIGQMLLGKYLAYTTFVLLIAATLTGLLRLIGVPFLGDLGAFAGVVVLLTLASLGVGFLISVFSTSDSQAIQLSMIVLLLSIFFSGFFIELGSFATPVLAVSYVLPMTHGVRGLQDVLLRGTAPPLWIWIGLGLLTVITFALVGTLVRRQFDKA